MSQTYDPTKPQSGVTTFGQLYQTIRDHIAAATSQFSGTAFPSSPVAGQPCYRTDRLTTGGVPKLYVYTALPSLGESGWVEVSANSVIGEEIVNARGSKSSLDQRLDVALNEDGTLKAATTLNPSQWYLPSLTFTYLSTTSFKVNGDQTDIYKATRRLKINLGASTVYSEVVSASYSAPDTTIQILDAVLDNTLVSVEHSLFLPDWDGKSAISTRMAGNRRIRTVSTDITTTINDEVILVDASGGARTITVLAAATLAGRRQKVIKIDSSANAVTIDPNGSETINGNATYAITVPLTGIEYESDGTNLRTIDDEADKLIASGIVQDFVVSGLLGTDPGASLTMTIPGGTAYVLGRRVVKLAGASDLTRTYTASKDTYVDISHIGAITYTEVANGAGAPAVAANSLRLMKVVTNATEITGATDLRALTPGIKDDTGITRSVTASPTGSTVPVRNVNGFIDGAIPGWAYGASNGGTVTLLSGATTVVTRDLGSVVTGQRFLVAGAFWATKGATAGRTSIFIQKDSGTATALFQPYGNLMQDDNYHPNGANYRFAICGWIEITGSGTLIIALKGSSDGSNSTVNPPDGNLAALRIL